MKVIVYSVSPQSPHLAADLELASRFKVRGDTVTLVRCTGQLRACLVNPNHNRLICAACKSKYQNAIDLAQLNDINFVSLPLNRPSYELLPQVFRNIDELRAFTLDGLDAGAAVASTLIGRFNRDHRFDTIRYRKQVYRELQMWSDVYYGMGEILDRIAPDEVYFFNGRFSSLHPLKSLCIKRNITFYTHERAGVMNKYIVRRNAMPMSIDYTIREINELWDKGGNDREEIGKRFFTDRRNNVIQSWVSFTESQKKGLLPDDFDSNKKNIAIFNSTMEEYEGMEEWRNPIYKDEIDGIDKILKSFKNDKSYKFYLRVHPNLRLLKNAQMREIVDLADQHKNLYLIRPEATLDSYALMDAADKVITFGSTMGVESTFWNKASILLAKAMYVDIDACYQPVGHEEVVNLIRTDSLMPKNKINALKYGHWELMNGVDFIKFHQLDLFTMAIGGKVIEANAGLIFLEKISKLWLVRSKRDVENVKQKIKNLLGWR